MRATLTLAAVALALVGCGPKAKAPAAVQAFDLHCKGDTIMLGKEPMGHPTETTFRVDLDQKLWCRDSCDRILPIKKIDESVITMADDDLVSINVNRFTGDYFDAFSLGGGLTKAEGQCEKAPFSGFPEKKF